MKLFKIAEALCCTALMSVVIAPSVNAGDWNKKTVITFGTPVEIPGVHLAGWAVLPAGTYVFKLLDSQSDRHIVQIFNKDETTVYATILAVPNERLRASDKTIITFRERPAGQPEALRAWFYPGSTSGEEFVYPKAKALELAKAANSPVLFTPVEMPLEVTEPIKPGDAPVVVVLKQAPVMAIQPTGEEVQLAEVLAVPAPVLMLPATASSLPLIGLLGLMAISSSVVLGAARRLRP